MLFITQGKTNYLYVLFVAAIAIIASSFILGYYYFWIIELEARLVELEAQLPIVRAPKDETVNWKTYRNEEYGFETKYDPESSPNERIGNETVGQFTYLLMVGFGTNPLKFPHGYELTVSKQRSLDDYRSELVGHKTDKINSEEEIISDGNTWIKINYQIFLTTDYVPITTAIAGHNSYSYAITSSEEDINLILSTFRFLK